MQWAKIGSGEKVHAIVGGKPICYCPAKNLEYVDTHNVEDRCQNCDEQWRARGRETKKKGKRGGVAKGVNPKTLYRPRHKFEDT